MPAGTENIQWLPMGHACSAALRELDISISGIDERWGPVVWGEGVTDTTLLFVVDKGRVTSIGDGLEVEAAQGECLVVPAGSAKRLKMGGGTLRAIWMHLLDTPRWEHLRGPVHTVATLEQPSLLRALMENLTTETLSRKAPTSLGICMAETMAAWLVRNFSTTETPAFRQTRLRLRELWQAVSLDLAHPWSVVELAERFHVSPSHLHRLVREIDHDHPMRIVARMRMQKAAGLLLGTSQTLDAIAEKMGYTTAYAFSHAFLREMGVRPGEYRNGAIRKTGPG